jgi:hypothetical protein
MNLPVEWLNALLGFVLTLAIFSYLLGDNPLFRLTIHLFVGVSSGYIAAIIFRQVWLHQLFQPLLNPQTDVLLRAWLLFSLLLAVFLLTKISPRLGSIGTPAAAILSGIAAGLMITGAVQGTLIPQLQATAAAFDPSRPLDTWLDGLILLVGAISTLAYFHFGADQSLRRRWWIRVLASSGLIFLGLTLGALFAALYSSTLTALIERLDTLISFFLR